MSNEGISRREFLAKSAIGAAGIAIASVGGLAPAQALGANNKLSIGMIGVGTRGGQLFNDIKAIDKTLNVEVTAICDTWRVRREQMAANVKKQYGKDPRQFSNYEDLLALDDVDAVVIATPDFSHARILTDAIKAGKDVYIEKPMASDLEGAKAALDANATAKRIVQVGTQRRSEGMWKATAKLIQSGVLGTISRVEIGWNDSSPRWKRNVDNIKPEDVDWKRFLMGRPDEPFNPHRYGEWQLYRDFTNGPIAVLGAHYFDVATWVMDDPFPSTCVANGGQYVWKDGREHEDTIYAVYDFPKGFALRYLTGLGNDAEGGMRIYGTNGMFKEAGWSITGSGGRGAHVVKEEIEVKGEPNDRHMGNWIECIRSRKTTNAPIEVGYHHAVATIMGYNAMRSGRKLKYLPVLRRIVEA